MVAATGSFGIEPGILFMVQFFWQFPHFWAIGWMMDDDYKKAGFKMLPTGILIGLPAFQIVFYTFWTIIISITPYTQYSGALTISLGAFICLVLVGLYFLLPYLNIDAKKEQRGSKKINVCQYFIYQPFASYICFR